jgi:hypothetical protein
MPEFRYAQPVTNYLAGNRMRMQDKGIQLNQRGEQQRQAQAASGEERKQAEFEQNQQIKQFDLEMAQDKKKRMDTMNRMDDVAKSLLSVLEAPEEQQQGIFQQMYPNLDEELRQEWFPDGQWNADKAMTAVRSSLSVLDRLKMAAKKAEAQTDLEKERIKAGAKGGAKTADYNLIRKAIADGLNATFDEVTGSIRGLSSEDSTTAKRIAARAERIFKDGGGDVTPTEAATKALDEWGYKGRPPQSEADKMKLPENDPLGLR